MDLDQEFIELYEGWKKGKYTIKDKNGKILGTYSSGSKAQKAMDDLMQKGDYDKLEVSLVESEVKHECPKCKGEGCDHCDGKGYHLEDEDDDPVGKNEASSYRDKSQKADKEKSYKKKYGKMPFQFTNKTRNKSGVREDDEIDELGGYGGSRHKKIERDKYNKRRRGQGLEDAVKIVIGEMPNRAYKEKINTLLKKFSGKFKWSGEELYVTKEIEKDVKNIISKSKEDQPTVKVSSNPMREDYDKNQLLRVQHDERLIAEAGDICSLDRADLRSKSMQKVYDKKCSPEMIKKKKSIFGKIAKGLDLYNQNSIGEEKMEKSLLDTVKSVLVGEASGDKEAYQKFFNKALKKFGVDSPADLKDDEKKKFYDYVDKNWTGDHEEEIEVKKKVTEAVNLKKLKKEYEENEDKNYHRENYLLLAKAFGTRAEIKKVEEIIKRSEKSGSTSKADNDWMYDNINKYYDKIRNEEVKVKKEETKTAKKESKLFSHVRNLMKK